MQRFGDSLTSRQINNSGEKKKVFYKTLLENNVLRKPFKRVPFDYFIDNLNGF